MVAYHGTMVRKNRPLWIRNWYPHDCTITLRLLAAVRQLMYLGGPLGAAAEAILHVLALIWAAPTY